MIAAGCDALAQATSAPLPRLRDASERRLRARGRAPPWRRAAAGARGRCAAGGARDGETGLGALQGVVHPARHGRRAPAACCAPPAAPEPARAASGTVALQKEVEALREECKALERTAADVRAAMVALVAEVDALGAADQRAEDELNAAKARALAACAARRGGARAQRPDGFLDPRSRAHATAGAGGLREEGAGPPEDA